MIFKQYDNGYCVIEFSWKERIIILKKGKLHLSDENLKHFGNNLVKVVMDWQLKFNKKTQDIKTYSNKVDSK